MRLLISLLYIIFVTASCSDSLKPSFQKIEYASFDFNSHRTSKKDSVYISTYCKITSDGLVEINNIDDYHEKHTFYSFQLKEDELKKLDSAFNPARKLKDYLARTQLEEGSFYAGSYDYFRLTHNNGQIDSICIIAPYMKPNFLDIYNYLDNIIYVREDGNEIPEFDIPNQFRSSLENSYIKSGYLPKIKNPPPFKP